MDQTTSTIPGTNRRRIGPFVQIGLVLVLAVTLATGAVDRFGPRMLGIAAAQVAPDQTTIQDTITRADNEQAQAFSASNPALMTDTATPAYLQELTQINQDMANSGVAGIALVNVEWGPVSVTGDSATATAYETWTTTLTDGSTMQSRDENDYTLTLDSGAWKIVSDAHPSATGVSQPPTGNSTPPTANAGNIATSGNWAGYAATNGTYTQVSGTWTIPTYASTSAAGVSATWVGIGGINSRDLIQAGTQQQTSGTGQTQYQAWIELLPQASTGVPLSVHPGDSVSVSIDEQSTDTWLISFKNNTTGQTYQRNVQYTSSNSSAEWIQEAPSGVRAGVLPLDNFGTVNFTNATTGKNGQTESLSAAGATSITLIGANRQSLATPSAIGSDGSSFSVTRTAATTNATAPSRSRRVVP